jgi:hypothetical protein
MLEMPPSHVDEIRVIELQLARHTSNLIVFDGEDRCIRRADLEKAIQEVQLFFASRAALEFTGDRLTSRRRVRRPLPARDQSPQPSYRSAGPRDLGRRLLAAEIQAHDVASDVSHENPSVGE